MNREYRIRQFLNRLVFAVYLLVLIYLVLFKGPAIFKIVSPIEYTLYQFNQDQQGSWGYNLIPFRTIRFYFDNKQFHIPGSEVSNVFGNIILLTPFGFLLPLVFPQKASFLKVSFAVLMLSLVLEIIQFMANIGFSDIDDVILNVAGGMIGYGVYKYLYH